MARKSAKAKRIYEAGVVAYKGSPPAAADKMLKAIALMLTEATKPAKRVKKEQQEVVLPFGPKELYEACLENVPHIIGCEPYNARWFGRIGLKLQATNGLRADDLDAFIGWVLCGGLDFGSDWNFEHVIKHWENWIVKARNHYSTGSLSSAGPEEFMK